MSKEFKPIKEQIGILSSRKLKIGDYERVQQYLFTNNYYNIINGYSHYFRIGDRNSVYKSDVTFSEVVKLYEYDTQIKDLFLKYCLEIESHFKAIFAHQFAKHYHDTPYAYLKTSSYDKNKLMEVSMTISKINSTIQYHRRSKDKNSIKHYYNKYNHIPIWVIINYLTFGQVLYMYNQLPKDLKTKIANSFTTFFADHTKINKTLSTKIVYTALKNIADTRNACAHTNRLIDFICKGDIAYWHDLHNRYNLSKRCRKRDVFNTFVSMQLFLTKNQYAQLHNTLLKRSRYLSRKLSSISINEVYKTMGFPEDWHQVTKRLTQK